MNAAEVNRAAGVGMAAASDVVPGLARQYESALRSAAKRAGHTYRNKASVLVGAADPHHVPPTLQEVIDEAALVASVNARTRVARRRLVEAAVRPLLEASLERSFYERIVAAQAGKQAARIVAGARDAAAGVMLNAISEGWSVDRTGSELTSKLSLDAKWQGDMLARTDLVSLANAAQQQVVSSLDGGPGHKRWISAGDDRVRPDHVDANGQTVALDDAFDVGGNPMMYPGDPSGPDDECINCRCVLVYLDAADASLAHSDLGGITYPEDLAVAASAATLSATKEEEMQDLISVTADEEEAIVAASFSAGERRSLAKQGVAMPDGSYPIRNGDDLDSAIHAVGRGKGDHGKIRAHIIKRAKALNLSSRIPENWSAAGAMTADAGGLCDMLDGALVAASSAIDAAMTLSAAVRSAYEAEETAEGDATEATGMIASAIGEDFVRVQPVAEDPLLAAVAPIPFTADVFDVPEPDEPTPLQITEDGRIFGHAAAWNVCHTGIQGRCTTAPRSPSGYDLFHNATVDTADDKTVRIGKITLDTGHAGLTASREATAAHYDNTGCQGGFVRAVDGKHGIWVAGALNPDLPVSKVRALKAAALSGDWRKINGKLDLIGLLAVNTPGFPIPTARASVVASALPEEEGYEVEALVAAGIVCDCGETTDMEVEEAVTDEEWEQRLRLAVTAAAR